MGKNESFRRQELADLEKDREADERALQKEELGSKLDAPRKGADLDPETPRELPKFGEYAYEFLASTAERLLSGEASVADRHSQKFLNYVLIAGLMETRKKLHRLEKELGV